MIIHPIAQSRTDEGLELSARIEWEQNGIGTGHNEWYTPPERLWYRINTSHTTIRTEGYNSFLTALLPMAMYFNEAVHVRGALSPRLVYNLREYQRILNFWRPQWFSRVTITYNELAEGPPPPPHAGALCSYSGGVDSTYTLWSHLPQNQPNPDFQVTHAMYMKGFDTTTPAGSRERDETKELKIKKYGDVTDSVGVTLLVNESNINSFHQYDHGTLERCYFSWGSIVGAGALLYEGLVSRFYFSADNLHSDPISHSINHHLLPLLTTNSMEIRVDGAAVTKPAKLKAISNWPATYDNLIVCFANATGFHNCSHCAKCVRTAAFLDAEGLLHLFTTFPQRVNRWQLRTTVFAREFIFFHRWPRNYFLRQGMYGYAFDCQCAIYLSWLAYCYRSVRAACHAAITFPVRYFFMLSQRYKTRSPRYARIVRVIKNI